MKNKIHFITYGNATFKNAKQRLFKEANRVGWFDTVTVYGPENLSQEFKQEFNDILIKPRGNGYWIWKFDFIKQQLSNMDNNDILIYLDAGCSINANGITRFNKYIEMLKNSDESIISFQMPHIEKQYTNKELFHHFKMDVNNINGNSGQIMATVLIMKNTEKMMKIIDECIDVLRTDHLLVTDHYNKINQCNDFKDNRHDQSILSLVRKKHGSIVIDDETYFTPFGNKESLQYPFWATRKR
tara:strand:- start:6273 stop:6998 length:726 start_codon:yes stop_codon:yes gene_type:complete